MTVISMFVLVSDTAVETIATNKTGNQFFSSSSQRDTSFRLVKSETSRWEWVRRTSKYTCADLPCPNWWKLWDVPEVLLLFLLRLFSHQLGVSSKREWEREYELTSITSSDTLLDQSDRFFFDQFNRCHRSGLELFWSLFESRSRHGFGSTWHDNLYRISSRGL